MEYTGIESFTKSFYKSLKECKKSGERYLPCGEMYEFFTTFIESSETIISDAEKLKEGSLKTDALMMISDLASELRAFHVAATMFNTTKI